MVRLNETDRIRILMMIGFGITARSHQAATNLFNATYRQGMDPVSKSTVTRLFQKFEQRGTVKDLPRAGRPPTACNEENQITVALGVIEDPHKSLRQSAAENDISVKSVSKIIKKII